MNVPGPLSFSGPVRASTKKLLILNAKCYKTKSENFRIYRRGKKMYDELTEVDIKKMQEEIDYRYNTLRPKIIEDVKTARAFGDLSENFEYKAAKREKSRNESRIRYLEGMIKTAKVISGKSESEEIGLFDIVEIYIEDEDETQKIKIVTTLRQNALKGLISKESPVGKALMGHRVGDRVCVEVNASCNYYVVIRAIEKGTDDDSLPISAY